MKTTAAPARERSARPHKTAGRLPRRRIRLAGDATSLREARLLVGETLVNCPSDFRDAAVLLTGELVTNAVVHGGGWFLLQVDASPGRLRVEVTDAIALQPRLLALSGDREHGRGMAIVDALATRWGAEHIGSRKVVWFEICLER